MWSWGGSRFLYVEWLDLRRRFKMEDLVTSLHVINVWSAEHIVTREYFLTCKLAICSVNGHSEPRLTYASSAHFIAGSGSRSHLNCFVPVLQPRFTHAQQASGRVRAWLIKWYQRSYLQIRNLFCSLSVISKLTKIPQAPNRTSAPNIAVNPNITFIPFMFWTLRQAIVDFQNNQVWGAIGNPENVMKVEVAESKLHELKSSLETLGKEAVAAMSAIEAPHQRLTLQRLINKVTDFHFTPPITVTAFLVRYFFCC